MLALFCHWPDLACLLRLCFHWQPRLNFTTALWHSEMHRREGLSGVCAGAVRVRTSPRAVGAVVEAPAGIDLRTTLRGA